MLGKGKKINEKIDIYIKNTKQTTKQNIILE